MAQNFTKGIRTRAIYFSTSSTAGTDYSDQVDTHNAEGCRFVAVFKSTAASTGVATWTIVATDTSTAASTSYTSISGASLTVAACSTASQKRVGSIDVFHPPHRYLKSKLVKSTKMTALSMVAEQYGVRVQPAVNSTATYARTAYAATTAALSHIFVAAQSTST